jgi:hypothetical protein
MAELTKRQQSQLAHDRLLCSTPPPEECAKVIGLLTPDEISVLLSPVREAMFGGVIIRGSEAIIKRLCHLGLAEPVGILKVNGRSINAPLTDAKRSTRGDTVAAYGQETAP